MKKILILLMSCNDDLYRNQAALIKESIYKQCKCYDISNVDVYEYVGNDIEYIDETSKTIYVDSEDDLNHTFKKTANALSLIYDKYDFILRTNTSTFINVRLLLELISNIDDDTIWCSEIYNVPEHPVKYGRGNGLLLQKCHCKDILANAQYYNNIVCHDDYTIGEILHNYNLNSWIHGWVECKDIYKPLSGSAYCKWNNKDYSFGFLNKFITIQVKSYDNANIDQHEKINMLTNVFCSNTYENISNICADIMNSKPSIFLGYFSTPMYTDTYKPNEYVTNSELNLI